MDEDDRRMELEAYGLGCAMEYFSDHEEVLNMIGNLEKVLKQGRSNVERAYERFVDIFKLYHEQPHLLDTHLETILNKMIGIIRNTDSSMELKHSMFKYMYIITNVRGYKVIVRQLPHEVADFEPVLQLLEMQNPTDPETWTTRYILLLWMSIIVMIPFHMSRLDGFDESGDNNRQKTVMERVFDICKIYTVQPDKCRDAASFLISKFLTRVDVKEKYLNEFLKWACDLSLSKDSSSFVKYGTLSSIAMIIKHGKREDIFPHAHKLLCWVINEEFTDHTGSNIQKLVYKIVQRIGLIFLPPKIAKWRYQRGNRSLTANLSSGDAVCTTNISNSYDSEDDGNFELPEEIEEIIDQLIHGLKSTDSVVRWSAAKGIGRVTGRLPKDYADDVVGSVLELFSPREGDGAWHGGCLALAELGRRGLLLPSRLPQVVPVVMQALVYDEPRGYASVGSHIRDSACYVCWSFARAYETSDLAPFVNEIAAQLLIVTCFDREINCRRAASAAFQENVGRQGTFPHGIDILTSADFFAVSVRSNAFLSISVFIAKYEEYTLKLIDHVVERKVPHWDITIRGLAAKALHNLTPCAPEYMSTLVLDNLFTKSLSIDLHTRHGAILTIGEVLVALDKISWIKSNSRAIPAARNLILTYHERLYFRGLGGEVMKMAFCQFIKNCSLAHMPYHNDAIIDEWLQLLNECLCYEVYDLRISAIAALPSFLNEYLINDNAKQSELIDLYIQQLNSEYSESIRMGHALALGTLPDFLLESYFDRIIKALLDSLKITPATLKWSESRRDAIKAITDIIERLEKCCSDENLQRICMAFISGLGEYTKDNRGDIGAWVREAGILGLQAIIIQLSPQRPNIFDEAMMHKIIVHIAQQAVEKIDRTRAIAGTAFYKILQSKNIPYIPNHQEIFKIFTKEECFGLNWNSASVTFPIFVQLIQFPKYTYNVLLGLVCSIGGMTETLVKSSSQSFFNYLETQLQTNGKEELCRVCDTIFQIYSDYQKNDRIAVPMLKLLDKLFASGHISIIIEDEELEFAKKIFQLTQTEINGCRDIYKLIDCISFLCQYVQIKSEVCKSALVQLSILLCHRQPYVRKSTATKLFEAILVYGDNSIIPIENLDEVQNLLSGTNWENSVEELRPIRNNICVLMGTRIPVLAKPKDLS